MNITKQTRDAIILGSALLILIGVAVSQFKATGITSPAPANANGTAKKEQSVTASTKREANPVAWVENARLPQALDEVKSGRDPFKDLLLPPKPSPYTTPKPTAPLPIPPSTNTAQVQPVNPIPAAGENTGRLTDPLPLAMDTTVTCPLAWLTIGALENALNAEGLGIIVARTKADKVTLTGSPDDVARAVELLKRLDVPPPPPPFVLAGVITTPTERYVAITLNGRYYSLFDGESMPDLGWTVKTITSTGVILVKGKQRVELRLAGGKVK